MPAADLLLELSRAYAARGDLHRAELALWAADVHTLEDLLWENGLSQSPDPAAQLSALGEMVAAGIEAAAEQEAAAGTPAPTGRAAIERARSVMVGTFDASVHDLLTSRLAPLDHLDAPGAGTSHEAGEYDVAARLAGRTPAELATELRAAAADCMAVAGVLAAEGEHDAADRMARQSDAAAWEAHLVASAVRAGDDELASVGLRWDLARLAGAPDPSTGEGTVDRELLLALVGRAERDDLAACFEALPAGEAVAG